MRSLGARNLDSPPASFRPSRQRVNVPLTFWQRVGQPSPLEARGQEFVDSGLTPSTKDLATPAGLSQIVDVAIPVVRDRLSATDSALITEAAELIRRARLNASQ